MSSTSRDHGQPAGVDPHQQGTPERRPDGLPPRGRLARRWARVQQTGEAGMSTAEYAVGTVAACAFAAVLYQVVTGGSVVGALGELVQTALSTLS